MLKQCANMLSSEILIVLLTFSSLKTCASLQCDESASSERQRRPGYHYQRNPWMTVIHNITMQCSGVELPLPRLVQEYSCDNNCTRILEISSSNISVVPSAAFSNLPSIVILRMEKLHIEKILPGAFNSLHSLKEIYLGDNSLTELSPGIFNSLYNLKILDLSKNKLRSLGTNCLTGTLHLETLNLSSNFLTTFGDSVLDSNIIELVYLDLSFNHISKFSIENIRNRIINVDLSWNRMNIVDFCVTEFKSLNISRNKIKSLHSNVCSNYNSRIVNFDASYNEISDLAPDTFINMATLNRLSLQNNNISSIPIGLFYSLLQLIDLNLSNNNLKEFGHGTFESLEKLNFLNIANNELTTIKRYFHSLVDLSVLNIQQNKISDLDSEQLIKDLPHLSKIYMDGNNFTCDDLIGIIYNLRNKGVNIEHGSARNISNIHGISCADDTYMSTKFSENIGLDLEKIIRNKFGQFSDQDHKTNNDMHEYFNDGFKNSNFYKYLEGMQDRKVPELNNSVIYRFFNEDFVNSKFYKYLENLENTQNSTTEFNKRVYDYFNGDFQNSSFVRFLKSLKSADYIPSHEFSKSIMDKYFNGGFEESKFHNYLENLKAIWRTSNSSTYIGDHDFHNDVGGTENIKILLTITVVLLVIIAFILTMLTYIVFNKSVKKQGNNEQVELIDA